MCIEKWGNGGSGQACRVEGQFEMPVTWFIQAGLDWHFVQSVLAADQSMEPQIQKGDIVLFDCRQIKPEQNSVMVIQSDRELIIRTLISVERADGNEWMLLGSRPESTAELLRDTHRIMGKVVWRGGGIL